MSQEKLFIAQIGRTVGLHGDLKLHLYTDFPEQFQQGVTFQSSRGDLTVAALNLKRGTIRFVGFENIDEAKKLTNVKLYADTEQTKALCDLKEGEHFWFDIIGCQIFQGDEILGRVEDIQRMADVDYLSIKTDERLRDQGLPEHFLLPYIERYIVKADTDSKAIFVKDAKDVLEAS